jgi:biopolymer transport protein ExbD
MWKQVLVSATLVVACDKSAPPRDAVADVDLVVVTNKLADVPGPPVVTVTKTAVLVGGKAIMTIANGKVDAADKEGGALAMKLPKLVDALTAPAKQDKQDTLVLALDRTTPYQLLISIAFTAKSQPVGYRRFALLARTAATSAPTALIINMPDTPRSAAAVVGGASATKPALSVQLAPAHGERPESPSGAPLGLVVSASATELRLWSTSSAAGTLQAPKLRIPLADAEAPVKLRAALAEVATQSFSGPPPEDQRAIIFMGSQSMQAATFIPVMAAMQSVFPDLLLSVGVE